MLGLWRHFGIRTYDVRMLSGVLARETTGQMRRATRAAWSWTLWYRARAGSMHCGTKVVQEGDNYWGTRIIDRISKQ